MCILIDSLSRLLDGFGKRVLADSPIIAEAIALRDACSLLHARGISRAKIFSDCKKVISVLDAGADPPWEIEAIVFDILNSIDLRIEWSFVPRNFNRIAHKLAREAMLGVVPQNWFLAPPVGLS